jgi:hypothetical protein
MEDNPNIDLTRFIRATENTEVARQQDPRLQLRSQAEKEKNPDYYQVQLQKEGRSEWSGGRWSGR